MQITSWQDFEGKNVALLGAGSENLALWPYLKNSGAKVTIHDQRPIQEIPGLDTIQAEVVAGANYLDSLDRYDIVFRIAGLPVATLENALNKLKRAPLVTSPADLFLALAPCRTIGVTGTKGKGTTATMIASILEASGKKVAVIGNIGQPMFDSFKDLEPSSIAVIELSSFQLEDIDHSPDTAVLLPIGDDHLQPLSKQNPNFHPTVNDYVAAKAHIILHQQSSDTVVYAADNDFSASIADTARSMKISVSQHSELADYYVDQTGVVYNHRKPLLELTKLSLQGQHVFLNATMAIATARHFDCREIDIAQGLVNWRPLPHRLQNFLEKDGVTFVDDSYATSPDAAIAAIQAFDQPLVWLGGGSNKGATFDELAQVVAASSVKSAILIGEEAPKIEKALTEFAPQVPVSTPKTLAQAVEEALKIAVAGDVVLLSPATASKDMFASAADRGDQFQRLARGEK